MKLSEIKGADSLDVLAEIAEPAVEIMADEEIRKIVDSNLPKVMLIKPILKNHKDGVVQILAALERQDPDEFVKTMNILTLPKKLMEILDDKELLELFQSQGEMMEEESSGSASESTGAGKK
jgi:hypothetical protein